MTIKKISMIGFKSFMDKLAISFPTGISGIVGPNGCGKSNIVDAIRWAMGEQSAKQLRGRQMEDIIFNGAGDVKPLGMAEVSIILENGNGLFPADFVDVHEISVTRRLYRSGESEYLLNNVPCRLKEIQEIFMDTGLGSRPYSIIGQGKISSIVEQRPEETRTMIDSVLTMIPGPTPVHDRILDALARPTTSHLAPSFQDSYRACLENLKKMGKQPHRAGGSEMAPAGRSARIGRNGSPVSGCRPGEGERDRWLELFHAEAASRGPGRGRGGPRGAPAEAWPR